MSRTPMFDPMTSDARSSLIAGLTEACNKIAGILDMKTNTAENISLPELYIEPTDRYRIYQAPLGNKLWLHDPAPIIKKNGTVIEPETDGFSIDYLGGSIAFESGYTLNEWDVITADVTYIVDESNKINDLVASIKSFEEDAGKNKGAFENPSDLSSAFPEAKPGDFAIVTSENAIYIWDDTKKEWVNANAKVDLTNYFTKEEMEQFLNEKQDNIVAKEVDSENGESATDYFYAGDKTWVSLLSKIKGCALSGLVTSDSSQVEAADTLLVAIGKLQAQINGFIHPIIGTGAPTTSTAGVVGQDYINTSNGDKYRMVSVNGTTYTWKKYGETSVENFTVSIPVSSWSNRTCTITDSKIQSGTNYTYFVGPADANYTTYNESGIYADDVKSNGSMTFHASDVPTIAVSVNICKLDGSTNGKVYNVGGRGGSSKDAVTVSGGGHMTMEEIFGPPPYEIEFTSEELEDTTAKDIIFDGTISGLDSSNVQDAIDNLNTGKQNKLTGAPGQVVGFGKDGAAVAVSGWSNTNLLDNWYFPDPVNQKIQKEYDGETYTIDRWKFDGSLKGNLEIVANSHISVTGNASSIVSFGQSIPEYQYQNLFGKTLTFSILTANGQLFYTTETLPPSGDASFDGTDVNIASGCAIDIFYSKVGKQLIPRIIFYKTTTTVSLVAAKLELGSQQTLAHKDASGNWVLNDPPPDKTLELLKCQRYFQVFSSVTLRPTKAVDFRPTMRIDPALSTIEIDGVTYYTADANL